MLSMQRGWVRSLVRELRSYTLRGMAKKIFLKRKKKRKKETHLILRAGASKITLQLVDNIIYEMSRQSRFDARYWMLGAGALGRPRGMVWGGRREEGSGWGTHVYLWRIHFDIWQN